MRKVLIFERKYIKEKRKTEKVSTGQIGFFHQFGIGFEELEEGTGQFTTAVIELMDGTLLNADLNLIKFIDELKL